MKRFIILIIALLFLFCGCDDNSKKVDERYTIDDKTSQLIENYYDEYGNLIQRIQFDKNTRNTIITTYIWERNEHGCVLLTDYDVVTVDSEGNIISSSETNKEN